MAEPKEILSVCCRPDTWRVTKAQMFEHTEQDRDWAQKGGNQRSRRAVTRTMLCLHQMVSPPLLKMQEETLLSCLGL